MFWYYLWKNLMKICDYTWIIKISTRSSLKTIIFCYCFQKFWNVLFILNILSKSTFAIFIIEFACAKMTNKKRFFVLVIINLNIKLCFLSLLTFLLFFNFMWIKYSNYILTCFAWYILIIYLFILKLKKSIENMFAKYCEFC